MREAPEGRRTSVTRIKFLLHQMAGRLNKRGSYWTPCARRVREVREEVVVGAAASARGGCYDRRCCRRTRWLCRTALRICRDISGTHQSDLRMMRTLWLKRSQG